MHGAFPGRPRIFRDPIHGDICFTRGRFQQLFESLLDTPTFQRLRRIRQNGVMNLVFHGAEHSRFAHSVGAAHIAAAIFDAIVQNTPAEAGAGAPRHVQQREDTILAALLHDVGHGPFSHTLEEITKAIGVDFHHEEMTTRLLTEESSDLAQVLRRYDPELPARLVPFIDKSKRDREKPLWFHAIASSQLDADRLDYLLRDAYMAGIRTHSLDLRRLVGALGVKNGEIVVDARARDVVDSYLLALDHMYASAYYHHTNRAASFLLTSILRRAYDLGQDASIRARLFPPLADDLSPLWEVFARGLRIPLPLYQLLDEALVWTHLTLWRGASDPILRGLVDDLHNRRLPKTVTAPTESISKTRLARVEKRAKELFSAAYPDRPPEYYICLDIPTRRTYTSSTWNEGFADSIKLVRTDGEIMALEQDPLSVVKVLNDRKPYPSIIVPLDMRDVVVALMKEQS